MLNALSVDVEDWFQVGAFEKVIAREDWDGLAHRVERNSDAVLALFDEAGVKGTFFTLGWVAARYPALIRRIVEQGHEIASHGWDHARVFTMTPASSIWRAPGARSRMQVARPSPAIARPVSRSTGAAPGRMPCWPRRAMPIRPASPR
jgi:peptidoglycan/xylan/chitin deacetylase (PgdA/CDA1 family)